MALAKYFSKNLLAINRLLKTEHSILEERLNSCLITIAFDENAINTFEGSCTLDLIIRLFARLYPKIKILDLHGGFQDKANELKNLALRINSNIEFNSENSQEEICIVAGWTEKKLVTKGIIVYLGSDNWISKISLNSIQKFGSSANPFGSGFSACLAASNAFRYIFRDLLSRCPLDEKVEFSVFSLNINDDLDNPPLVKTVFQDLVIVGIGAIGNGLIWGLSKLKDIQGEIHLVDHETVSLSNLQRYILLDETDEGKVKVEVASDFLMDQRFNISFTIGKWGNYVQARNNFRISCVAVCIDNDKDRIGIQSSLPKMTFNSFTEVESIGLTRHRNFSTEACLSCSYIPLKKKRDFFHEVADNCNVPERADLIKVYYNANVPVNIPIPNICQESLLQLIANANSIEIEELAQFNGMVINQFYSNFVCGGVILQKSKADLSITNVDAPLAFQSAMAGILLAAELVRHFMYSNYIKESRTDIYHLSPIMKGFNPYHRPLLKDDTGRCICQDVDFIMRYLAKWDS